MMDRLTPDNNSQIITMRQMASLLGISRSRLYQLISQGVLLPPVHLICNRRPFYTEPMSQRNLQVKNNNLGINGQVILFYQSRTDTKSIKPKKTTKKKVKIVRNQHHDLIRDLENLGLDNLTAAQVDAAISIVFPDKKDQPDYDHLLITIFRYLKHNNSTDNVGR